MRPTAKVVLVTLMVLLLAGAVTGGLCLPFQIVLATSPWNVLMENGTGRDQLPLVRALPPHLGPIGKHLLKGFADSLSMDVADVVAQLKDGKTLRQIVQEQGSTPDAVFDTLSAKIKARLADAVAQERITQQQMDQRLAKLREGFDRLLDSPAPLRLVQHSDGKPGRHAVGQGVRHILRGVFQGPGQAASRRSAGAQVRQDSRADNSGQWQHPRRRLRHLQRRNQGPAGGCRGPGAHNAATDGPASGQAEGGFRPAPG